MSARPPSLDVDATFGSLLICTFGSIVLLTGLFFGTWTYYRDFGKKDPIGIRLCVAVNFLTAVTSSACSCALCYEYLVTYWGNPTIFTFFPRSASAAVFVTGFSCVILQFFLVFRIFKIAPSTLFASLTIPVLCALALLPLAGSLMITIRTTAFDSHLVKIAMYLWFIGSAVSDVAITSCMLYCFFVLQRRYPNCPLNFKRLMIRALASGLICCAWSIATLIVWRVRYDLSTIAFLAPISSICGVTLIANLGFREVDPALWTESEERSHRALRPFIRRPAKRNSDVSASLDRATCSDKEKSSDDGSSLTSSHSEPGREHTRQIPSVYAPWIKFEPAADGSDSASREPSAWEQIGAFVRLFLCRTKTLQTFKKSRRAFRDRCRVGGVGR